ncbi:hypothetical protein K458DRAFT_286846 [Lentithecium fluviatile CBS 122367]|uniref:KOW domain-containing protein n=1 Tax=Lentithecium fluviatile CBS 122367 TaxID=1168545 RepID=A0A6G1JNG1_9PLEO|nr:hypothetical protein K458DRAFT_286846 [Lentithecium fluviatile CBS 122367]
MSQLAKAPLRSARSLKKAKEIQKVEAAIKWHERARKKRQELAADRYESKQVVLSLMRYNKGQVRDVKRKALKEAREDWKLGPLRPNRAVGHEAGKYGVLEAEGMRRPAIPVRVQQHRNEVREKKGQELEYPLVVDEKKYFHIVKDDRVVVIKGKEKGKIGIVSQVIDSSHEVLIKDMNKHYADANIWNVPEGQRTGPKRETEVPISLADVRLVVPYRIATQTAAGETKEILQDVVVDKVVMERHTTGIDPYTQIDYGKDEFPEEHRFDPETGRPIFKRYVAGTRSIIQWPWEFDEEKAKTSQISEDEPAAESEEKKGRLRRSLDFLKKGGRGAAKLVTPASKKAEEEERKRREKDEQELDKIETTIQETQQKLYLKGEPKKLKPDSDDDTGRNLAEVNEESRSFYPTLVYPPFPNELAHELAEEARLKTYEVAKEAREAKVKDDASTVTQEPVRTHTDKKGRAAQRLQEKMEVMKTPMQLRWEVERAKKLREEKPLVQMDQLLLVLGSHMERQGIKLTEKRLRAAEEKGLDVN